MSVLYEMRRRAGVIAGPVLGISLMAYFGYHLVQGERGLLAWLRATQELKTAKLQLAELDSQRAALDRRVSLLRSDHLDLDMLDEQARGMLNLSGKNEIVIMRPRDASR